LSGAEVRGTEVAPLPLGGNAKAQPVRWWEARLENIKSWGGNDIEMMWIKNYSDHCCLDQADYPAPSPLDVIMERMVRDYYRASATEGKFSPYVHHSQ
jgi:hypothetical protein